MMNVSSYRSDEFFESFANLDRQRLIGIEYKIDRLRAVPIIAYGFLLAIGAAGNAWVACVIGYVLGERRTRAPKCVQIYILALCACDLIVLLFSLALIVDLITGEWLIESVFLCRLYLSSESLNKFCAPFLLVALSYFCYVKICRPTTAWTSRKGKKNSTSSHNAGHNGRWTSGALIVVVCSVVVSFALLTPVYIYGDLHYIVYENASGPLAVVAKCAFEPSERVLTIFTIYGFILSYAAPATLFTCFHAAILHHVRKQAYENVSARRRGQGYLFRVTQTILGLVVFYMICWTPYWTLIMWQALTPLDGQGEMTDAGVVLNYFVHMLPYVNCTGYPILYTLLNRDIRQAYKKAVSKRQSGFENEFSGRFSFHRSTLIRGGTIVSGDLTSV